MNLTFTELDNLDGKEEYNEQDNYETYYENIKSKEAPTKLTQSQELKLKLQSLRIREKPKKKSVSYDDILASMNTVVIDGKLEFIRKDLLQNATTQNQGQYQPNKKVTFNTPPQQHQQHHQHQQHQQQFNKNSYIYNKYFKDYKEPSQDENLIPQRPLTKNELKKKIILDYVNKIKERNRIAQIKSTKLLFTK